MRKNEGEETVKTDKILIAYNLNFICAELR